ncbi:MAG: sulfurtransferase [Bacillaceae bacterium]|nr:sulfurtransferase [Bacillaceae bacterium]
MNIVKDREWCYSLWESEEDVVWVDCRFYLQNPEQGRIEYEQEHIPGAYYFDLEKDLSSEVKKSGDGGRHPLPDPADFVEKLQKAGISNHTIVIAYDQNHAFASRFVWLLKYVGHENVYLLNGGIQAWKEAGYPTDDQIPAERSATFEPNIHPNMTADQEYVKHKLNDHSTVIIDSRSYERYAGIHEPIDARAGHIPGAKNYFWMDLFSEQNRWKDANRLKGHFKELTSYDEVIVYCGSGVTATPNVISLWESGFNNIKLYPGSFSDWISNPDNQIDTKKK